ncbi:MAG: ribose 5-phosphate isomerase A [Candidatus Diapherotrites archaeon CG11_big_fil_rev_8_21_14_0_20_37_9]|nr:MAG: ribose 5-phosphate isomerase A [Candidatus Diapherotrites archaeon CG11_big_fil_rev_8_21_14_0_20_37_9]
MEDKYIEDIVVRYIKEGDVISVGSSELGNKFIKRIALALEEKDIPIFNVEFVPTSLRNATIAASVGLPIADINDKEVDVAIEFVDQVDNNYNFIKRNSSSLVRDKMIAQSAGTLVVIADEKNFVDKLKGTIPFEVAPFGWRRTMNQLDSFGKANIRKEKTRPVKTESGNYIIDVYVDNIFSYDELEYDSKNIPGVLETGLFLGYADKIVLHGKKLQLLSRTEYK